MFDCGSGMNNENIEKLVVKHKGVTPHFMGAEELGDILTALDRPARWLARMLNEHPAQVDRWTRGRGRIPQSVATWLRCLYSAHITFMAENPPPVTKRKQ